MRNAKFVSAVCVHVETLETRRFLSAGSASMSDLTVGHGSTIVYPASITRTSSIVGTFTGTYVSNKKGSGTLSIVVSTQTRRNVIYGTFVVRVSGAYLYFNFVGSVSGTTVTANFTGKTPKGKTETGTFKGTLTNSAKTLSGTYTSSNGDAGTFKATRP